MSRSDLYKNLRRCGKTSHYWAHQQVGQNVWGGFKSYSHSRQLVAKGDKYHSRELPQVLFLSRQTRFCREKKKCLLSRQRYACHDQTFVATKLCLLYVNKIIFVATNIFRNKHMFVTKNICRNKYNFVATKVLSQQAYFCRDKRRVLSQLTCVCRDKNMLVATNIFFCRDKNDTCGSSRH